MTNYSNTCTDNLDIYAWPSKLPTRAKKLEGLYANCVDAEKDSNKTKLRTQGAKDETLSASRIGNQHSPVIELSTSSVVLEQRSRGDGLTTRVLSEDCVRTMGS